MKQQYQVFFDKNNFVKLFDNKIFVIIFDNKFFVMKNIIGSPARKDDFFFRKREVEKLKKRIEVGAHLQVTAPRRVGKTSIMMYFLDNPMRGYHFVYVDTESIEEHDKYFKKIYEEILRSNAVTKSKKVLQQLKEKGNKFLSRIKGITILENSVELNETEEINYEEELINFLRGIDLQEERIVLLNDEFPYTIENIIAKENGETTKANTFLKANRALRQDPEIIGKLQIIYTGSIGLNALVERIGKTELINDLDSVSVKQLSKEEALELINKVLETYGYKIDKQAEEYLLKKIEWLIPFHIQLALKEIMDLQSNESLINEASINEAFNEIIDYRNNNYFDHYYKRLNKHLLGNEFKFAVDVLNEISKNDTIHSNTLYNLAVKYGIENNVKSIIGVLVYDGYINNNDTQEIYRFNSPIIKMWWYKHVCN